jgi:hypothetical protein
MGGRRLQLHVSCAASGRKQEQTFAKACTDDSLVRPEKLRGASKKRLGVAPRLPVQRGTADDPTGKCISNVRVRLFGEVRSLSGHFCLHHCIHNPRTKAAARRRGPGETGRNWRCSRARRGRAQAEQIWHARVRGASARTDLIGPRRYLASRRSAKQECPLSIVDGCEPEPLGQGQGSRYAAQTGMTAGRRRPGRAPSARSASESFSSLRGIGRMIHARDRGKQASQRRPSAVDRETSWRTRSFAPRPLPNGLVVGHRRQPRGASAGRTTAATRVASLGVHLFHVPRRCGAASTIAWRRRVHGQRRPPVAIGANRDHRNLVLQRVRRGEDSRICGIRVRQKPKPSRSAIQQATRSQTSTGCGRGTAAPLGTELAKATQSAIFGVGEDDELRASR